MTLVRGSVRAASGALGRPPRHEAALAGIVSDVEMIRIQDIEAAFERMQRSDVKYRFVIEMASLKE